MTQMEENPSIDWHTELNLFEPTVIQTAIQKEYDRDYLPLAPIVNGAPIEFLVNGNSKDFLDLNDSQLEIKVKLTKSDGSATAGDGKAGVVNLPLHSAFSSADMELGGKLITEQNTVYPYRALFETIINLPKSVLESRMLCEGFVKDKAGKLDQAKPVDGGNDGLKARAVWFNTGATRTFIGRPHMDLFNQEKLIPPNIDLKFRFIPSKSDWMVVTGENEHYKFVITSARLYIHAKEASPDLLLAHAKMLEEKNYRIQYTKVSSKVINIPNGVNNFESDNVFMGTLPDKIILALVANEDMAGGYGLNPFNFQNANITSIALKVNGELVPQIPLTPNFTSGDYIKEYKKVLEAMNFSIGPNCWDITPEEWAQGYNIWVFKITSGPIGSVRSIPRQGSIRLELKFGGATGKIYNVLLFSSRLAEIQIDRFNNVMLQE